MTQDIETKSDLVRSESVSFTDLEIPASQLNGLLTKNRPTPASWQRVQFNIPNGHTSAQAVEEWLKTNCPSDWTSYNYSDPKSKNHYERVMVVRFENKDDALLFKLRGGHQAWEQK